MSFGLSSGSCSEPRGEEAGKEANVGTGQVLGHRVGVGAQGRCWGGWAAKYLTVASARVGCTEVGHDNSSSFLHRNKHCRCLYIKRQGQGLLVLNRIPHLLSWQLSFFSCLLMGLGALP